MQKLQHQNDSQNESLKAWKTLCSDAYHSLKARKDPNPSLQTELETIKTKNAELMDSVTKHLQTISEHREGNGKKNAKNTKIIGDLQDQLREQKTVNKTLSISEAEVKLENENISAALEEEMQKAQDRLKEVRLKNSEISTLEGNIASLKSRLEEAESKSRRVFELEENVHSLEEKLEETRNEKNQVEKRLMVRQRKVKELQEELETAKASIHNLQEENNKLKRHRDMVSRSIATFSSVPQWEGNDQDDAADSADLESADNLQALDSLQPLRPSNAPANGSKRAREAVESSPSMVDGPLSTPRAKKPMLASARDVNRPGSGPAVLSPLSNELPSPPSHRHTVVQAVSALCIINSQFIC